jgi:hypothetical protein
MKRAGMLMMIVITAMILLSCKKEGITEPEEEPNYEPGRRDYTWTADTIKAYYLYFDSIWGLTLNDVWAVSGVASVFEDIYRYNGNKWTAETSTPIYHTNSIWGTSSKVFICCGDGRIWNYQQGAFSSSPQFKYEGKEIYFRTIEGKNDNEICAAGGENIPQNRDAILYKYTGNIWLLDNIVKNFGTIFLAKYSSRNNKYYFLSYLDNNSKGLPDTTRLVEYEGEEIKTIAIASPITINIINGYLFVTIDHKIYRYYKDNFENYLEVNLPNFGGQIWGRNKNDFFIRMKDGLLHYNGSDLQYLIKFPSNITFGTCALVLEKDVFVHAFDDKSGYNIIYHGKLK